jgi:hypothetical protein
MDMVSRSRQNPQTILLIGIFVMVAFQMLKLTGFALVVRAEWFVLRHDDGCLKMHRAAKELTGVE